MEEEGEEAEEEERTEQRRREARRRESQVYCPPCPLPPLLSVSCVATLPELLQRRCSARLARDRRRHWRGGPAPPGARGGHDAHSDAPASPAPTPTPTQEPPASSSSSSHTEPDTTPPQVWDEGRPPPSAAEEGTLAPDARAPETQTPPLEPPILLEPSRTSTIPPHSFSDTSLTRPTPTQEEEPALPPVKDSAVDPPPPPVLQGLPVPETQQAGGGTATPTPSPSPPLQPLASETASPRPEIPVLPVKEQPVQPLPTATRPDVIPPPTELPDAEPGRPGGEGAEPQGHGEPADPPTHTLEPQRGEESVDDLLLSAGNGNGHRTATDFYAELQGAGEYGNGGGANGGGGGGSGAVHGSSQKESVFMRLNNRIKALEMNMSLSSRYLEELSQRYRKQMEEMQRAFNKTIIKLQNTSRIAEEQDQRQTESIQMLQSQLENVTKLMLNLTITVSQLQREVSDRQSYLVVSLVVCLSLGLLLCLQCCRSSSPNHSSGAGALPKSNHYPSPKRCFSSYDDMSLKRRVSCPLVRSKSFQLPSTEVGPDDLYIVEPLRFSPEKKKKRCKVRAAERAESLKAPDLPAPLANGDVKCNGFYPALPDPPPPPPPPPLPPSIEEVSSSYSCSKEFPSESSSCGSSTHSEESYAGRLAPPSPPLPSAQGLCNGHALPPPLPPSRKRSEKRRRSRPSVLPFTSGQRGGAVASLPTLQQLMKGNKEIGVGTIGVTAVTGHV